MLNAGLKDVPSAQRLAAATAQWQQLSDSEADVFHSQAATINASLPDVGSISNADTAGYTHKIMLQMSSLVRDKNCTSVVCA